MPADFYWDGIMFIILGIAGLVGIFILSRQIKELRESLRMKQGEDEDDDDSDEDDSDEDDSEEDDDEEDEDDDDDEEDDDDDDDDEEDDDDDDDDDEDIEVGSHVGVEHGGEEWSGTIVEFDDEEDEVLVKNDDDDKEVWVPFASLFVE
jgi:flagellar biosynthesis/type III secretory pathway M-ring protein FliF/YscJ